MIIRASELFDKEVILTKDGSRLGFVGEIEINTKTGQLETIIILGKSRFFGLLGKTDDIIIPFNCCEVFGDDVILVNFEPKVDSKSPNNICNLFKTQL